MSDSKIIEALAADIREVDGDHTLGASALAEKLVEKGWNASPVPSMPDVVTVEYPREEGDTIVLGPGVFVAKDEKVLNWNGRNYVPQGTSERPLKSYKVGESVDVYFQGDWLPGTVHSTSDSIVSVSTDRGPKTVAAPRNIRTHVADA